MTETETPTPTQTPRKPRRWLRRIFFVGLLLAGLVVATPWIVGKIAPTVVTQQLDKHLNARAALDEVDVSYDGRVKVRGFKLDDLTGRPLVSVGTVDIDADVRRAINGLYQARVDVDGFEVHLRRGEDGRFNLQDVVRPRAKDDKDSSSGEKKEDAPPQVEAHVRVKNGKVVIHGADGTTELVDISFDADVMDLARPVTFSAGLGVQGPGGPGGTVKVTGTAVPLPAKGDETARATAKVIVDALLLRALAPALSLVVPGGAPTGRVDVDFDVELLKSLAVRGGGDVKLTEFVMPATREGAPPVRFDALTVTSRANLGTDLSGTQTVKLAIDDFLTFDYEGAVARTANDGMELAGQVVVDGSLGRLAEIAGSFVPMKQDVTVTGRLSATTDFNLAATPERLSRGSLTTKASFVELAARGPDGPIDLGSLSDVVVSLTAKGDLDQKTAGLERLDARLGPVHVRGHAAASGIDPEAFSPDTVRVEDSRFEIDADLDRLVRDLRPLVDLSEHGIAGTLAVVATAKQTGDAIALTADVRPTGLVASGITVDSDPLSVTATVTPGDDKTDAVASMQTDRLSIKLADGRQVVQRSVKVRADLEHKTAADVITLRDAGFRSDTAEVDVKGRVLAASDAAERTAELGVDLRTALATVKRDLAAFLGDLPYDGDAAVTTRLDLRSRGPDVTVTGKTTLKDLDLTVKGKDATKPPLRVTDPSVVLDLDTALAGATGRVTLSNLGVESRLIRGKLSGAIDGAVKGSADTSTGPRPIVLDGIAGEFFYVPDRLAVLLAPYLPAEMKGSEEERITFDLNGRLEDFDPYTLLASSKGGVRVGLGTLLMPGIEAGGDVALQLAEGRAELNGDLGANGGKIDLVGDLGTSDPSKAGGGAASFKLDVTDFALNAKLGEMLNLAHPLFSSLGSTDSSSLGGLINANVQLAYAEPLTLQRLARDWQTLDPNLLEGGIKFRVDNAIIKGSPLLSELLGKIDVPVGEEIAISPVNLTIGGGKLTYAEPWTWKFGDMKTNFTGSVDFARNLDLGWNLPITKKLVKKYDFLESLKGESIAVPLTGTASNPNLQFDGILSQLAGKAAKAKINQELSDRVGSKIPGLDDILKDGDGKPKIPILDDILKGGSSDKPKVDLPTLPGQTEPTDPTAEPAETMPTDPDELLKKADALWNAGEEKAARKLYKELKKHHQLTLVFQLNKSRIEDRAKK